MWDHYEDENYPSPPWEVQRPAKYAATHNKWIVRTVEGEAESEKIFYNSMDAQSHCEQQLSEGKCAHLIVIEVDDDDIPF